MHQQADIFLQHKTRLILHKRAPDAPWLSDYCLRYFSITWAEVPRRSYAEKAQRDEGRKTERKERDEHAWPACQVAIFVPTLSPHTHTHSQSALLPLQPKHTHQHMCTHSYAKTHLCLCLNVHIFLFFSPLSCIHMNTHTSLRQHRHLVNTCLHGRKQTLP